MPKISKKRVFVCLGILLAVFVLASLLYSPIIFQEGNPWPEIKGIAQLKFGDNAIVKLSGSDNKFMTESKNGTMIHDFMKAKGYEFTEQMGSGYFFKSTTGSAVATHKYYSRHYSLWNITETNNADSIEWTEYKNEEYSFAFRYPKLSVDNQLWGNLTETLPLSEILLPNQVLSKNNNFYLHQKYNISTDWQTGKTIKKENTFIPEYDNTYKYPLAWHFVILNVESEKDLDKVIKQKLGPGCSYKTKIATEFSGNYRIEIDGDGKDLGSTLCPVNYSNYIIYSPNQKKVAFWSTGQECQIGLGFFDDNCFDQKISDSFHFVN